MFPRDPIFELDLAYAMQREREQEAAQARLVRAARAARPTEPGLIDRGLATLGALLIDAGLRLRERYAAPVHERYFA
jgi:hypothetical protein